MQRTPKASNAPIRSVAIGELLWDLLPSGPRLGGTTSNFAIMSARLGALVTLVSRLGDDVLGAQAREVLENNVIAGLDLSRLQTSPTLPTGTVSVVLGVDGQPSYSIAVPVAWDEIEFETELGALAAEADVVCFGSLAQRREPSRTSIRRLVESTLPTCLRVCDVNLRAPFCDAETLAWCVKHSTILKISEEELPEVAHLLGMDGWELPHAPADPDADTRTADFARALLARAPGCDLVALTLGARGSMLVDRSETHREPGRPVTVIDTIGAGDAFTTGLVYAYLRGGTLAQISKVGNLCGSFVASRPGATPEIPASLHEAIADTLG